jgi:class 3 adenylate cyclase
MANNKKRPQDSRRVTIIFAADVAGYSRLMANNEDRTLALLERSRSYIDKKIEEYNGRIANTAGDSIIAVFASATEAFDCSIVIQRFLLKQNEKFSEDKRLLFRVGLHMGEIYTRGSDVLGSGVNIAARLEGSTEPGAICMSETFLSIVDKSVSKSLPIADLGYVNLKNIDTPIRAFEVLSSRARRSGIEFKHQSKVARQKRMLLVFGSAALVILFVLFMAIAAATNFGRVAVMAVENGVIKAPHSKQTIVPEEAPLSILPPPPR